MELRSLPWLAHRPEMRAGGILNHNGICIWVKYSYDMALGVVCSGMGERLLHGISRGGKDFALVVGAILFEVFLAAAGEAGRGDRSSRYVSG